MKYEDTSIIDIIPDKKHNHKRQKPSRTKENSQVEKRAGVQEDGVHLHQKTADDNAEELAGRLNKHANLSLPKSRSLSEKSPPEISQSHWMFVLLRSSNAVNTNQSDGEGEEDDEVVEEEFDDSHGSLVDQQIAQVVQQVTGGQEQLKMNRCIQLTTSTFESKKT